MTVDLVGFDSIVVGSFNPAIPHPAWYARLGIIDAAQRDTALTELGLDGQGLRHTVPPFRWSVGPAQFICEPVERPILVEALRKASGFVVRTLEQLPHTPLSAAGNNFHFSLKDGLLPGLKPLSEASGVVAGYLRAELRGAQTVLSCAGLVPNAVVNITVVHVGQGSGVHLNFHSVAGSAEEAIKFISAVEDHYRVANQVVQQLAECGKVAVAQ